MPRNDQIRGNAPRKDSSVLWYDPDVEADRPYVLKPLTKGLKLELSELRAAASKIIEGAQERSDLVDLDELGFGAEDGEALVLNACEQINLLTTPKNDGQGPLGDLIREQWEADKVIDNEIFSLTNRLVVAAGKPSAS